MTTEQKNMRYGATKAAVIHGQNAGITVQETSARSGIPENRLRYAAHRLGLKLKGVKPYLKYGSVKEAIHAAYDAGLTYAEAEAKYGIPRLKLHAAAKTSGCYLKPSKRRR